MSVASLNYLPGSKNGIRLKVMDVDAPRAIEILKSGGYQVEDYEP
jgi:hypothetical protein